MRYVWLMSLGERNRPDVPGYAEDIDPREARAAVLVDDFADLVPVLLAWRDPFGSDITAYAMRTAADENGRLLPAWADQWKEEGPTHRLDTLPGGFVHLRGDCDARPQGRSPFLDGLTDHEPVKSL
ncbi:hypothetical protein [Streptomyces sp. NPDC058861]|uniref:hypothetical protein n=1 Tax=Streptomyces sp. NPDC058861 TaxID=3346653 RepID=UPI00367561BE